MNRFGEHSSSGAKKKSKHSEEISRTVKATWDGFARGLPSNSSIQRHGLTLQICTQG